MTSQVIRGKNYSQKERYYEKQSRVIVDFLCGLVSRLPNENLHDGKPNGELTEPKNI